MSAPLLTVPQTRVIGCLIEKQLTTPLGYPMTPNAVRVGCNQKSNRDPQVDYDDNEIFDTLRSLDKLGLIGSGLLDNTQTVKYRQTADKALGLERGELVILCELFNRGAQTPGELRSRCERMHAFADLADVQRCLEQLVARKFVVMLDRLPGTKEHRWAHLFCGTPSVPTPRAAAEPRPSSGLEDRVAVLEAQVKRLEERLAELETRN